MDDLHRSGGEMMGAAVLSLAGSGPLLAPGSGGDLLAVRGHTPVDALQRVVSQDLRTIPPGGAAFALVLAPKGQVRGVMVVFPRTEDVLLLAPPGGG
jgi:folate-binding Fe-S cluster repair protein YgfZ